MKTVGFHQSPSEPCERYSNCRDAGISSITWTVHVSRLVSPHRLTATDSTSSIPGRE
ncbi:MAG: hypothetical protein NTZ13_00405 [Candidatus Parcubacteria bacterium]|nr:hypothetical protein [Candidatus Parcubacteria bacterium]